MQPALIVLDKARHLGRAALLRGVFSAVPFRLKVVFQSFDVAVTATRWAPTDQLGVGSAHLRRLTAAARIPPRLTMAQELADQY